MEIHSLISTFENALHQHAGLGYFVDLLLKSLFVLVLMVMASIFTRKLPASLRHLFWCVGFTCLFVLPLFIGLLPKIQVPITTSETVIIENTVTHGIATFADNIDLVFSAWWQAFLTLYFSFLAMQLLYTGLGLCKVISLSRCARPIENPKLNILLENLVWDEGITVPVQLKKSPEVFSPVSWGLFSPEIILPEQAEDWCVEKTRNVLIHELSHIQRLDWLTTLVVRITRAIYWYNPLIWFAARKLEEEAEQACDDAVILTGRSHSEYASNLLEIASHGRKGSFGNTVVQAIAGSFLGSRVFSILDTSKRRQNTEVDWVVRGLLIGCTSIAILASLRFVPLVNVTSIDPYASTAFSVIFIPRSEAAEFDEVMASIVDKEQPVRTQKSEEQPVSENTDTTSGQVVGIAAKQENQAAEGEAASTERTSVLEEYLLTTDIRDESRQFESFVNNYTSDIIRDVESSIDLSSFGKDAREATQARLVAICKSNPEYPQRARLRGVEGYTVVEYAVDSTGQVRDPVIVDSSPRSVFDRSSLRAIQSYRFEPPKIDGEIVSLEGRQTRFVYQLKPG